MSLDGLTAVVTGAAAGIGRSCAIRLAQDGADVAVMDRNEDGLAETATTIEATGRRCVAIPVDLTDRAALEAAFAEASTTLGTISVLHSNAGGPPGVAARTFAKSSYEQFDRFIALNLTQNVD